MDTYQATTEHERRTGNERRNWACDYEFPYIDGHGILVTDDRRQNADRRDNVNLPGVNQAS